MVAFVRDTFVHYRDSNTFEKGAALSYYTAFSFLPITMILTSGLDLLFQDEIVSGELYEFLAGIVGKTGAGQLEDLLAGQHLVRNSLFSTLLGIGTLLFAATGMFNQIHNSLNAIWRLKVKSGKGTFNYFARHLSSLAVIILIGFLLFMSTALNSILQRYSDALPQAFRHVQVYEHLFSFLLVGLLFAMLFKITGNAIVPWRIALISAAFTSVLFILGKLGIGLYIARSHFNSTFGTASVLAILLIWVYYSSQILFLGASFAYILGKRTGREIKPTRQAVRFIHKEIH
ncbi:MAG: YihY/virulence factor BrkB family protein [Bacteroidales bacterium]